MPPGEILLAELKAKRITQAEFALRTSLTPEHVGQPHRLVLTARPEEKRHRPEELLVVGRVIRGDPR